jgi:hypothetical protein
MMALLLPQQQQSSLSSQTRTCLLLNEIQSVHSLQSVLSTSDLLQSLVLATHKYSQYISCLPSITYHPESLTFHTRSTLVTSSKLLIISLLPTFSALLTTGTSPTVSTLLRLSTVSCVHYLQSIHICLYITYHP